MKFCEEDDGTFFNDTKGNCAIVGTIPEARMVLPNQLSGTRVVAKDAHLQIELNPAVVLIHRWIGYDN